MKARGKTAKEIIIETLKEAKHPLRTKEIVDLTGLNYNTVRGRLQELKREGIVKRVDEGWVLVSES